MSIFEIILTAVSLSLDAVAISIAAGILKHHTLGEKIKVSAFFGLFQFGMPIIGLAAGSYLKTDFLKYGNLIGFVVLSGLGLKMLWESLNKMDENELEKEKNISNLNTLLILSLVTSIDALFVGFTFNFISLNIPLAVSLIGIVTFLLSFCGINFGNRFRELGGKKIEIIGSIILIFLALKILIST